MSFNNWIDASAGLRFVLKCVIFPVDYIIIEAVLFFKLTIHDILVSLRLTYTGINGLSHIFTTLRIFFIAS